jgi:ribosomal-protein-alanine N-acetyltransferase
MLIESPRLLVRPWAPNDLSALKNLFHDEGFLTFLPEKYHSLKNNEVELRHHLNARIEMFEKTGYCKFPVFLKSTNQLIGTFGVGPFEYRNTQELEAGIRFRKNDWGRGYATEAANLVFNYLRDELSIPKVYAYILPENKPSQFGTLKMGFEQIENIELDGVLHYLYVLNLDSLNCKK